MISSELEEIASYSDHVVVLRDRRHVPELLGDEVSTDTIMTTIASHCWRLCLCVWLQQNFSRTDGFAREEDEGSDQ